MMLEEIEYIITITKVTNPESVAPLQYTLPTSFNSVVNQQFTHLYAIENALPLTLSYDKSNNTFGQNSALTVTVISSYPSFNEIKMSIPSDLLTVTASSGYTSALLNNAYQLSQIYTLTNNEVVIATTNPTSTAVTGKVTLDMFKNGYLSASGEISIAAV